MRYDKKLKIYLPDNIRPQNSGYGDAGASWVKRSVKGFLAQSGSPQQDIDLNNYTLRQRARMLYMASPVATSAIKTNRTNVVGIGLRLQSRIDREALGMSIEQAEAWQKKTEREFAIWANSKANCDATGVNDFYGMQQLALTSWLMSGDSIGLVKLGKTTPLNPYAFRLHIIEADRVATPTDLHTYGLLGTTGINQDNGNKIYDGVEIDNSGKIIAYYVRSTYPLEYGLTGDTTKWERIKAYQDHTGLPNVIHVMDSERPDQYRGVTYLAQVIEPLLQLRRYTESELMAALVESFYSAFIKTTAPTDEMPFNETKEVSPEMRDPNDFNLGPGTVNILNPGEDVTFGDPKRPASGFPEFIKSIAQQVGAALEIPRDLLLKEFTASYSASRAALLEAWKAFKTRREWITKSFCRPAYEIWMSEAVARGRIQAPGFFTDPVMRSAYLGSEWIGPAQGQIDPVKEMTAEVIACSEGFSTHEQSTTKLNGGDWNANIERLKRENEALGGDDPDQHQNGSVKSGGQSLQDAISREIRNTIVESITMREEQPEDEKN
jgi:lambda family phage portal protein